jgi:hypothetical protein
VANPESAVGAEGDAGAVVRGVVVGGGVVRVVVGVMVVVGVVVVDAATVVEGAVVVGVTLAAFFLPLLPQPAAPPTMSRTMSTANTREMSGPPRGRRLAPCWFGGDAVIVPMTISTSRTYPPPPPVLVE